MKFRRSIKFNVWARFEAIVIAMLAFTYVFLIVLFPSFYEWMKTYEIAESMAYIKTSWSLGDSDNFGTVVTNIARKNKMYIEVSTPYRIGYVDYLGGSQSLSQLSKTQYQQAALDSDTGVYYDQIRDERENNTVLMMCTYIGTKDDPQAYIFICSYLQPIGTTVAIFQRQFLFVSLIMMMLTLFVSLFFANKITNPIININKHAKDLPQGKFDAVIDDHDFNEIQQLASTLQEASKEIAKSDDLRRELMANISHDLRTPLTMIKAYAEMIRDLSGDNPEKRARHLKVIIDETDRLSSLVNDILDLSKLQAGVTEMNMTVFDLSERLSGVISRFDILKENDGIIIKLEAEDNIVINADITKLEQVVYNLINNAVTYTGDDNTVIVRLFRKEGGLIRFEVTDHGDGIAPEYLPYIWDRYYKVSERNKTHKRAKMGSGIGLSIVKNVLEQHGFKYGADSEVGKGSTFWFEAPEYHEQPEPQPEQPRLSLRLKKGGLFEIDDFICRTDFYKSIQKDCQECYLFEKRDMKYCFDSMTRFAKMILEKYGENIILLKTEPKDSYIDLDNRLRRLEDDGMYEIKKKFISLCEERFASVTGCYVIDISKHFYASDSFPLGGAHIVHYEEEFYRQAGEYINEIISGSSRHVFSTVDDNYLLLRNLRLNR